MLPNLLLLQPSSTDWPWPFVVLVFLFGLAVLALAVAYVLAPFMLYAIYSRIGETNDLLRYMAERGQVPAPTPAASTSREPEPDVMAAPTFRQLG